jgi:hypothetical protein
MGATELTSVRLCPAFYLVRWGLALGWVLSTATWACIVYGVLWPIEGLAPVEHAPGVVEGAPGQGCCAVERREGVELAEVELQPWEQPQDDDDERPPL